MTANTNPAPGNVPQVQTRQQLEVVLENIVHLQQEREALCRAQESEIATVRQKYRAPLAEMDHYLHLETSWAEAWARAHPNDLASQRSLRCCHATIGFRVEPLRLERASRRWTWSRIALTLASTAWGKRYLRIPAPEVDKEALLADIGKLSPIDLRNAGLKIVQGESFFILPTPSEAMAPSPKTTIWAEAA